MFTENQQPNFVKIGKVVKPHGLKGELFVRLSCEDISWTAELKEFRVKKGDQELQWMNQRARPHKGGVLIQPKELSRIEEAEDFRGYEVFIPEEFFVSQPGENFYLSEVLGFSVLDEEGQLRGEIVGFEQISDQDLAKVKCGSGTFLMPFLDALTLEKDWENKQLKMKIPAGLESLNL